MNIQDSQGNMSLHFAMERFASWSPEPLPILPQSLAAGADVHAANNRGETPLLTALKHHRFIDARHLIEHGGAKADIKDSDGLNCLHALGDVERRCEDESNDMDVVKAIVRYLGDICHATAAVELVDDFHYHHNADGHNEITEACFPFELARCEPNFVVSRELFAMVLKANRNLLERYLNDPDRWQGGQRDQNCSRCHKKSHRRQYLRWKGEIDAKSAATHV